MSDEPTPAEDLNALIARVDPDRWLSSRFIVDPTARDDVVALYAYDHELARAPRIASNPLLGEVRLTWWREVLDEIFEGRPVRRHPTAQALAVAVERRSLPRAPLEAMIDARYREADPAPLDAHEALAWAQSSGGEAAALALAVLDPGSPRDAAMAAGAAWALARRAADEPQLKNEVERLMRKARDGARQVSAEGFPALAHAVFAPSRARGRAPSRLLSRMRIVWAVARGRL